MKKINFTMSLIISASTIPRIPSADIIKPIIITCTSATAADLIQTIHTWSRYLDVLLRH